jgi:hypothetical protein
MVKQFKFMGRVGVIDQFNFVCWGGMGFSLKSAGAELQAAVTAQTGQEK